MKLSEHFTLEELTFSQTAARKGIDNTPNEGVLENLKRLAEFLEGIRLVLDSTIKISSGFRCPALNKAIGGAVTSQHQYGCAIDFTCSGMDLNDIMNDIIASGAPYDQIIHEFDSWVHISIPTFAHDEPRGQALIIDKNGTRAYE